MAMEMLCAGSANARRIQDANGLFRDVKEWEGISFDSDGNIAKIDFAPSLDYDQWDDDEAEQTPFRALGQGGSMDLQWIPRSVVHFDIKSLNVEGTIDTSSLPRNLKQFMISYNKFFGEFKMAGLPVSLEILDIETNNFSGPLIIADLPRGLRGCEAGCNAFSGSIQLADLPRKLTAFSVRRNQLCGDLCIRNIPHSIVKIDLRGNDFGQKVLVVSLASRSMGPSMYLEKEKFGKIVDESGNDMSRRLS